MSDTRNDDEAGMPPESDAAHADDLGEAGMQFDDELHDAEAEADDTFRS